MRERRAMAASQHVLLAPSAATPHAATPHAATPHAATLLVTPSMPSTLARLATLNSSSSSCSRNTLRLDSGHCRLIWRSFLYHAKCNHTDGEPWAPRRMLITGTGRSGTEFVAQMLRLAGLDVVHDDRNSMTPSREGDMNMTGAHGAVTLRQ